MKQVSLRIIGQSRSYSIYVLVALATALFASVASPCQSLADQRPEWTFRFGRTVPVDQVIGRGLSLGLGVQWKAAHGRLLATLDLAGLDSGRYGHGHFTQRILGIAYVSRPVKSRPTQPGTVAGPWLGGGLALIDELDKVVGFTLLGGCNLSREMMLEVRYSSARRWGFDYGATTVSLAWRISSGPSH